MTPTRAAIAAGWIGLGLGIAACAERVAAPGSCPAFCPGASLTAVDTVLNSIIARDSAFRGYVDPQAAPQLLAVDLPTLVESRPIMLMTPIVAGLRRGTDTTVKKVIGADSVTFTLLITHRPAVATNLRVLLYQLPLTIDSTTTYASLTSAFGAAPLLSVNVDSLLALPGHTDSVRGRHFGVDTSATRHDTLIVRLDSTQAPFVPADTGKLAFGIRVTADSLGSVAFGATGAGLHPLLRWFVRLDSINGTVHTTLHDSLPVLSQPKFNSFVFDRPAPALDSTLAVGGVPSARSLLRVALPRFIRDSTQIIRATLVLLPAVPPSGLAADSFTVMAHAVLADFGAKSPLAFDAARTDSLHIHVGMSDTVRIEVTNIVRFWAADTLAPTSLVLQQLPEAGTFSEIRFYPSPATAYRPALHITYVPRYPFGVR